MSDGNSSLRLILKDSKGRNFAIPLTDDLSLESGLDQYSDIFTDACERVGITDDNEKEKLREQMEKNTDVLMVVSRSQENIFVNMSLVDIFSEASAAKNRGELALDLTRVSGVDACIAAIKKLRQNPGS